MTELQRYCLVAGSDKRVCKEKPDTHIQHLCIPTVIDSVVAEIQVIFGTVYGPHRAELCGISLKCSKCKQKLDMCTLSAFIPAVIDPAFMQRFRLYFWDSVRTPWSWAVTELCVYTFLASIMMKPKNFIFQHHSTVHERWKHWKLCSYKTSAQ